jgi:hypothetical protein
LSGGFNWLGVTGSNQMLIAGDLLKASPGMTRIGDAANPVAFDLQGSVTVTDGQLAIENPQQLSGRSLNGGVWRVDATGGNSFLSIGPNFGANTSIEHIGQNAIVRLIAAGAGFSGIGALLLVDGTLDLRSGYQMTLPGGLDVTGNVILDDLAKLRVNGDFDLTGTVTITSSTVEVAGGDLFNGGSMSFTDATLDVQGDYVGLDNSTLELKNMIDARAQRFDILRQAALDIESTQLFVQNFEQGVDATVTITYTGLEGQHARIDVAGQADVDGTLEVMYAGGFAPTEGTRLRIIDAAGGVNGAFATFIEPTAPVGDKNVLIQDGAFIELLSTDLADFDEDGSLSIFDFLLFGNLFSVGDLRADLDQTTGPGVFDIFDFLAFQNLFVDG